MEGIKPEMDGRMVRTDRYKYCVFSRGMRRESLVDMQADPFETVNLASDQKYREILLQHRERLARFGVEHGDALVDKLLSDDVKPIPFEKAAPRPVKRTANESLAKPLSWPFKA